MKRARDTDAHGAQWYDFFCGGGLAAYGACAAGFAVAQGVDNDAVALAVFKRNFPDAQTQELTLGPAKDIHWPLPAPNVHVHLSPPCGELSTAKAGPRDASGALLLRWSVEQAATRKYASWSVETVVSPETKPIVAALVKAQPKQVASAQIDAASLGSPQSRVRLIIGPPALIERLRRMPCPPRVSIRQAYEVAGRPLLAAYVKNHSMPPAIRSVQDVAPTVCASRALIWCDFKGDTVKCMGSEDSSVLMGIGSNFLLSGKHYVDQRVLGNGICFHVAKSIAQAAKMCMCPSS